jgi:BirA family transcriptional regulator, biotin operon repressor / biotin---[acetyl-CoA-carboxylase] ligase
MAVFSPEDFSAALRTSQLGQPLVCADETGSTNDDARAAALEGFAHGSLFLAESQTQGRGRRGNVWMAPAGSCLLVSLLLRPKSTLEMWPRYTHAVGLAVLQALDAAGLNATLKWPNDVYLNGKKVAGILLESSWQGAGGFVVAGFGINVFGDTKQYPVELRETLTTVEGEGSRVTREWLLAQVLNNLQPLLTTAEESFPTLLEAVWERNWIKNQAISLQADGQQHTGQAVGLSSSGGLLLRQRNGEIREFWAADFVRKI